VSREAETVFDRLLRHSCFVLIYLLLFSRVGGRRVPNFSTVGFVKVLDLEIARHTIVGASRLCLSEASEIV
jgi:hypothetical protein